MKSLDREFTMLEKATLSIGWCETHWWNAETGRLSFDDWKYADAVYRSRALDLPGTGHALVPFIDMANHASGDSTFALYDTDSAENAILVIREGKTCGAGEEITITYGDEKGACEMLFSYGFIEHSMLDARELYLDLEIPDDDPLKLAKKAVSKSPPGVRIFIHDQSIGWESPFVWLLCLNEEDGLDLKVLQNNDGTKELKAFWNRSEIENMCALESILKVEPLWDVFRLRATVILQARVEAQLILFESTKDDHDRTRSFGTGINHDISRNVMRLRELEVTLMLQAYEEFEKQVDLLICFGVLI